HGRGARGKIGAPAQFRGHGARVRLRVRRARPRGEGAADGRRASRAARRALARSQARTPRRSVAAMGILAMTRAFARLIVVLALAAGLSACGNKGPLVLPD